MDNLDIYNAVRAVPKEAQKTIAAGRLKGFTDINPVWRIKKLTEQFGPAGIGWKYTITDKRMEKGADDTIAAFVDIDMFIKINGEWSDAIPGTGGSMFVAKQNGGLYTSDECYKMALTDALSVACKALGVGANIYYKNDRDKYDNQPKNTDAPVICQVCGKYAKDAKDKDGHKVSAQNFVAEHGMCIDCYVAQNR